MTRVKQPTPIKREASNGWVNYKSEERDRKGAKGDSKQSTVQQPNGRVPEPGAAVQDVQQAGFVELFTCVGGIYGSFLTWALLQERITTTPYGDAKTPDIFSHSIFLNTVQSALASLVGYIYLLYSSRNKSSIPQVFPSRAIYLPLTLVSITSSLASPFGYASLRHVGYITFILAKSCKLLPVMALHISVFRKRYPLYKYIVVALVTAGVAIFTLQHPTSSKKAKATTGQTGWGIALLAINLLFDGLTNSTQDYINATFAPYSGSQMMCAQNIISTLLTSTYLIIAPYIATSPLGSLLSVSEAAGDELQNALGFMSRHPGVGKDILAFAACGAVGQVFIFFTLAKFSSLLLVTITVTRKMLTMLLSVVWFGHSLGFGQWVGVSLVFGGVGAEAYIGRREKAKKELEKKNLMEGKKKE